MMTMPGTALVPGMVSQTQFSPIFAFPHNMYVGRILNKQKVLVLKTSDSVLKLKLYYPGMAGQQFRRQLPSKREFVTHRPQERRPSPGDHSVMH